MKIKIEKYPLVDTNTRQKAFDDPLVTMPLMMQYTKQDFADAHKYVKRHTALIAALAEKQELHTYLITRTITDYLLKHGEEFMNKLLPFLHELPDEKGCILIEDYTYFYQKSMDGDKTIIMYVIALDDKYTCGIITKNKNEDGLWTTKTETDEQKGGLLLSALILPFLYFAECETKIVNSTKHKKVTLNKERYITNIPSNIEIVDSRWFTTLVHSDAFTVSGHFRLQRIGEGRTQRKLTWIKDFEKHGYTRRSHIKIEKTDIV